MHEAPLYVSLETLRMVLLLSLLMLGRPPSSNHTKSHGATCKATGIRDSLLSLSDNDSEIVKADEEIQIFEEYS